MTRYRILIVIAFLLTLNALCASVYYAHQLYMINFVRQNMPYGSGRVMASAAVPPLTQITSALGILSSWLIAAVCWMLAAERKPRRDAVHAVQEQRF